MKEAAQCYAKHYVLPCVLIFKVGFSLMIMTVCLKWQGNCDLVLIMSRMTNIVLMA